MTNEGADYSLKICIMNASSDSQPEQRREKAMPNEEGFPAECTRERCCQFITAKFLWQGLKGTGQS